ncbi:molybdenum cofactor guanylyltransferase [Saccharibacillus sacchari]|uniref:molybdenum cofactor guanylyltransferase n=1 Tax=Saccharibacillus sacchari TaxID=456493 RepID=UPI0006884B4A|nr:molybdenum cofactor guanylyltransferase [Saccharibacillus sacchari]
MIEPGGTSANRPDSAGRRTVGILLAGGLSRRFGSPKAFARLTSNGSEGRMFYERALDALRDTCDSLVIVTNRELESRFPPELEACIDLPHLEGQGPLAGICTAMRKYPNSRYIVMACDMPLIQSADVQRLQERALTVPKADVVAVRATEAAIPLFGVWQYDVSKLLEESVLSGKLSVMKMLAQLNTHWIESAAINPDDGIFRNYNTPGNSDLR